MEADAVHPQGLCCLVSVAEVKVALVLPEVSESELVVVKWAIVPALE